MRILRLTADRVRNLREVDLTPGPGLNLLVGGNGAGKSSLLEVVHLLAYGRSFRGRVRDGLVRSGAEALEVFAEWQEPGAGAGQITRRAGLRHGGQDWTARLDGAPVRQLGDLCAAFAAITFEPGAQTLVSGGAEARRRFLDWGLFHVERDGSGQAFLSHWRSYMRALKQRNALLKQRCQLKQLDAWDRELATHGEALDRSRRAYLDRLEPRLSRISHDLLPRLGAAGLAYQAGWRSDRLSLADALTVGRERDLALGNTGNGPHRADWRMEHSGRPEQEALSRGQSKLSTLACLLAQAEDFAAHHGAWPVFLLDDMASELDPVHQDRLVAYLTASGAQALLTGTEVPASLAARSDVREFHVEHGLIRDA